jgi:hypothetical protein
VRRQPKAVRYLSLSYSLVCFILLSCDLPPSSKIRVMSTVNGVPSSMVVGGKLFAYLAPVLEQIVPDTNVYAAGSTVTLHGRNFGASALEITWHFIGSSERANTTKCSTIVWRNSTAIECDVTTTISHVRSVQVIVANQASTVLPVKPAELLEPLYFECSQPAHPVCKSCVEHRCYAWIFEIMSTRPNDSTISSEHCKTRVQQVCIRLAEEPA